MSSKLSPEELHSLPVTLPDGSSRELMTVITERFAGLIRKGAPRGPPKELKNPDIADHMADQMGVGLPVRRLVQLLAGPNALGKLLSDGFVEAQERVEQESAREQPVPSSLRSGPASSKQTVSNTSADPHRSKTPLASGPRIQRHQCAAIPATSTRVVLAASAQGASVATADAVGLDSEATGGGAACPSSTIFAIGAFVQVHSLMSKAGAALNGQNGRIVGRNGATGRWCVSFQGSADRWRRELKECNLRPVPVTNASSAATSQSAKEFAKIVGEAECQAMAVERAVEADQKVDSVKESKFRPDRVEVVGAGDRDANGGYIWTAGKKRYYKESGRGDGDYYTINPAGVKESETRCSIGFCPPEDMDELRALVQFLNQSMDKKEKQNSRGWTLRLPSQRGNASDIYVAPGSAAAPPPESGWECCHVFGDLLAPTLRLC